MTSELQSLEKYLTKRERMSYNSAAVKIYNDFEEKVFNLSEQSKNETIESIKRMSVGQMLKFQELISNKVQRRNTKNIK